MVELEAAGEQELQLRRLADHDQGAEVALDDVVDAVAQLGARRDAPQGGHQCGISAGIVSGHGARIVRRERWSSGPAAAMGGSRCGRGFRTGAGPG